jgi:hypothetical protein
MLLIRSGNYQVERRAAQHYVIIRLSDCARHNLSGGTETVSFLEELRKLEALDADRLGDKPSIAYCRALDQVCEKLFSKESQ